MRGEASGVQLRQRDGETPTGVAHYDTKAEIERHIRRLPLAATIVRPATFMELLVMPGFGLDEGRFQFLCCRRGECRCWRWRISAILSRRFCRAGAVCRQDVRDRQRQRDRSSAGGLFSAAAGRPILFAIFRRGAGRQSFLHKLTGLVDDGRLAGHADLDAMRQLHPQLHTFAGWLAGPGRPAFERALTSAASWAFDR